MRGYRVGLVASVALVVAAVPFVARAATTTPGTCAVTPVALPAVGPDLLRSEPVSAPELENEAPFEAAPLLVAGTEGYDRGEYLYQDYLWDDHGAKGGTSKQSNGTSGDDFTSSRPVGTLMYPTNVARYANNAADIVEVRIRPEADAIRYRIVLDTLLAHDTTAVTIAIAPDPSGDLGPARVWPFGAGISQPLGIRWFVVHHGTGAVLVDALSGAETVLTDFSTDLKRNHLVVAVPRSLVDPGTSIWRYFAGAGLWDDATRRYVQPLPGAPTATTPGNAGPAAPAFFKVAFRFDELLVAPGTEGVTAGTAGWSDTLQARHLEDADISPFHADVDFALLAAGIVDRRVPTTGSMNRIYGSRFSTGEGIHYTKGTQAAPPTNDDRGFVGSFRGRLMTYFVRIAELPDGATPGLLYSPHPGGANHNGYAGLRWVNQLGDERGAIVFTPYNRGGRNLSFGAGEAQAFEAWADMARYHDYDPTRVAIAGYSNGGWTTYKLGLSWPDLFGAAFSMAGVSTRPDQYAVNANIHPEDDIRPLVGNGRHIPYLIWHGTNDQIVPAQNAVFAAKAFEDAGLRVQLDLFPGHDHLTFAMPIVADEWGAARDFLGAADVAQLPARISFTVRPRWDYPAVGMVHDHAWWLSGVKARTATFAGGETGRVDARSHGTGEGDPIVIGPETGAGTDGPDPSVRRAQRWAPGPPTAPANQLDLTLTNIDAATVHLDAASLDAIAPLAIALQTDGDAAVRLAGLPSSATLAAPAPGVELVAGEDGVAELRVTGAGTRNLSLLPPGGCP